MELDRRTIMALVLVVALLAGSQWASDEGHPLRFTTHGMDFENNDEEMNAAIKDAQETADEFLAALAGKERSCRHFAVKVGIEGDDYSEHFWLDRVSFDSTTQQFSGRIANTPTVISTVRFGQRINVSLADISDWMFVRNGILVGGRTTRVMRSRLPESERHKFDASLDFRIE